MEQTKKIKVGSLEVISVKSEEVDYVEVKIGRKSVTISPNELDDLVVWVINEVLEQSENRVLTRQEKSVKEPVQLELDFKNNNTKDSLADRKAVSTAVFGPVLEGSVDAMDRLAGNVVAIDRSAELEHANKIKFTIPKKQKEG